MEKIIVLEVEDIKEGALSNVHKDLFSRIKNARVLVLLWSTDDEIKRVRYREIIKNYFRDLGADEVLFLEENDSRMEEKFGKVNMVYLPGGDTEILLGKLNKNSEVIKKLENFRGVIIGNSAGAIVLSDEGYVYKNGSLVKYKGLGIVNVKVLVHFEWRQLNKIGDGEIILLGKNSYVMIAK